MGNAMTTLPNRTRGSEWLTFQRCLAIFQRLQIGPTTGEELTEAVLAACDLSAYPEGKDARQTAFKRDRAKLRNQFKVDFAYDHVTHLYMLQSPGLFGYLELSAESVQGLRLLSRTFDSDVAARANIQSLIDEIIARLDPQVRRKLDEPSAPIELDIQTGIDQSKITPNIWSAVDKAVRQHRQLTFNYASPRHDQRSTVNHQVAPYRLRFQRGHWYLYAYDLIWRNAVGQEERNAGHMRFRLSYIVDDQALSVLDTLSPRLSQPPRHLVYYRLLPPLGRGEISSHFEDMTIERKADGSAEVRGYTTDEWEAARILLGYGELCVVSGGTEVLQLVLQSVHGMAKNYEIS
jgi:predicted DNA-binding transcriptional regulator YafY